MHESYSSSCLQIVLVYLWPFHHSSLLKCAMQLKIPKKTNNILYFGSSGSLKVIDVDRQHIQIYLQPFSRMNGQQC